MAPPSSRHPHADRPHAGTRFYKAHGLGNDYVVVEAGSAWRMTEEAVRRFCHRWEGVGSDGVVILLDDTAEPFPLRMFNPDGSEFERSGNGLRILASYLARSGRVDPGRRFDVTVGGDTVGLTVHGATDGGLYDVSVEMGRARTGAEAVGADAEVIVPVGAESPLHLIRLPELGDIHAILVSVGNPHCVVFADPGAEEAGGPSFSRREIEALGPALTGHPGFRAGTNVQIVRRTGSQTDEGQQSVEALIWERGVGHTTASGTSACAVAVASLLTGSTAPGPVAVRMEGGRLDVHVSADLDVVLRGPVQEVMEGEVTAGFAAFLTS